MEIDGKKIGRNNPVYIIAEGELPISVAYRRQKN